MLMFSDSSLTTLVFSRGLIRSSCVVPGFCLLKVYWQHQIIRQRFYSVTTTTMTQLLFIIILQLLNKKYTIFKIWWKYSMCWNLFHSYHFSTLNLEKKNLKKQRKKLEKDNKLKKSIITEVEEKFTSEIP